MLRRNEAKDARMERLKQKRTTLRSLVRKSISDINASIENHEDELSAPQLQLNNLDAAIEPLVPDGDEEQNYVRTIMNQRTGRQLLKNQPHRKIHSHSARTIEHNDRIVTYIANLSQEVEKPYEQGPKQIKRGQKEHQDIPCYFKRPKLEQNGGHEEPSHVFNLTGEANTPVGEEDITIYPFGGAGNIIKETAFRWTLQVAIPHASSTAAVLEAGMSKNTCLQSTELRSSWESNSMGIIEPNLSPKEAHREVIKTFISSNSLIDNRYKVASPWKPMNRQLADNKVVSRKH
ncbi:hypothetical protein HPB47_010387 [Ixodes persulcatus]|uniref:Uncharacterized protein n=1 Tax=Ixodes persulcatus TaxID=34615 RepID=A0AC60NZF6_IXOPE|nr:hypothetical protein HPB47_010387 [Ixodes persulcatus]